MSYDKNNALIILNYNKYELTINAVENVLNTNYKGYIVVVDNSSTNDSFNILKDSLECLNKNIYVIKTDKNGGYAYGNNFGIKFISNKHKNIEYISIMNPDVVVDSNFSINSLISKIYNRQEIAGITAMQLYNDNYSLNTVGWKLTGFLNILSKNLVLFDKFLDYSRYKKLKIDNKNSMLADIDVMAGCFFIIKLNILKEVNYLDENTFLYYEENILSYKIKEKGYKFVVDLTQLYIHDHKEQNKDAKSLKYRMNSYKYSFKSQKYYLTEYLKINVLQLIIVYIVSLIHLYIEIPIIHFIKKFT